MFGAGLRDLDAAETVELLERYRRFESYGLGSIRQQASSPQYQMAAAEMTRKVAVAVGTDRTVRLALADGSEVALPLGEGEGLQLYATLCTTLSEDMYSDEPIRLPDWCGRLAAEQVGKWLEFQWYMRHPELHVGFQDHRDGIKKIREQVHPDTEIDAGALSLVQSYLDTLLRSIVQGQPKTLDDARAVVQTCLPGNLVEYGEALWTKAISSESSYGSVQDDCPLLEQDAASYVAGVLEYCATELLELAGNASRDVRSSTITTADVKAAIKNDGELAQLTWPCSAEEAWRAAFLAGVAEDIPLLCSTLRLAGHLGVDELHAALAQVLADASSEDNEGEGDDEDDEDKGEGEGESNEEKELLTRIAELAGKDIAGVPKRRAFVLTSQGGPHSELDQNVVAAVAALMLTPVERRQQNLELDRYTKCLLLIQRRSLCCANYHSYLVSCGRCRAVAEGMSSEDIEELFPYNKAAGEAAIAGREYNGWVAKWTDARGMRCGYVRSAPGKADGGGLCPTAMLDWEHLVAKGPGHGHPDRGEPPYPETGKCDWGAPQVQDADWSCDDDDWSCAMFARSSVKLVPADDAAVATARDKHEAAQRRLVALVDGSERPPTVTDVGDAHAPDLEPIAGESKGGRPVYAQPSTMRNEGCVLSYSESETRWIGEGVVSIYGSQKCGILGPHGCAAAVPQDVDPACWEFHDEDANYHSFGWEHLQ